MSSCGLIDVLMHDVHPIPDVHVLQHEDLVAFGRLIIALCCANPHADTNLQKAMEIIGRHYSVDVKNIILFLISKPTPHKVRTRCSVAGYIN
jgi:PAB-dependent poly(A)-specific ribonuclease subunit 3